MDEAGLSKKSFEQLRDIFMGTDKGSPEEELVLKIMLGKANTIEKLLLLYRDTHRNSEMREKVCDKIITFSKEEIAKALFKRA